MQYPVSLFKGSAKEEIHRATRDDPAATHSAFSAFSAVNAVPSRREVRTEIAGALLATSLLVAAPLTAQTPSFEEVTGHPFGQRITQHHQMVRYLERLAEASPRVAVVEQGESWGGRSLPLAIVTSPENHARLDEIRRNAGRLGDPRVLSAGDAQEIIRMQPAVVWFGGSIHGFELSGTEGALKLLEHLTTRDDAATIDVLRNTVILIDPMLNPDGRDAFAALNHSLIGREPSADHDDWSNSFTGWQGLSFRTGHYFFDTNRDWFAHTQRETRARMPTIAQWRPQVVVDMHEMGSDVEFFFDPPDEPTGPYFPEYATRWFGRFNAAYAQAFDSAGFEYMTGERYNYFYPGYTTSWGSYQGAVGMLYEQGSTRGLALRRPDGSVRTLADALEQQYVAAWAAARLVARDREMMLREYVEAHRTAIADGRQGIRRYYITSEGDAGHAAELANLLRRNGVEVDVLSEPVRAASTRDRFGRSGGAQSFPAGTYVVDAAQPRNRILRALLEPDAQVPEAFLRTARERVDRAVNPRFYDITAWSLPLLFNTAVYGSTDATAPRSQRLAEDATALSLPEERARYAYLIDGTQAAAVPAAARLRHEDVRAAVTLKPTRIDGEGVASGSIVVRVGQNDTTVHEKVREVARAYGLRVRAVHTGLAERGHPSLGSGDVVPVRTPEVGILAEDGISGYSFGWAWYTLDRQYEVPVTVMRTQTIRNTRLGRFNVIVVPEAQQQALSNALGNDGRARLRRWVQEGGTLVTIGSATDFARDSAGIGIGLRSWYDSEEGRRAAQIAVPGAIFRVNLDRESWLSAGYDAGEIPALVFSSRVYLAPEGAVSARRTAVGRYAARNQARIAGHAWNESMERLPESVFLYEERVGQGRVIAFAEDPNFRAYHRGLNRLFLNAVLLGPSAP